MAAVPWRAIESYFVEAAETHGEIERQDVIDLAFAANASDDEIDAIDAVGSRVFRSVEDARAFLKSQDVISE